MVEIATSHARPFADYLERYTDAYRAEWTRFTEPPPAGAGYPALRISPYLSSGAVCCYIATDGIAIASYQPEPPPYWFIAGGPALMTDTEPSSVPPEIEKLRADARAPNEGGFIGIYRIVGQLEPEVARGVLPSPITVESRTAGGDLRLEVAEYPLRWEDLVARLTFGALGPILDAHLPTAEDDLWNPAVISQLGFMAADPEYRRFFNRLELSPHVDESAWDPRSIWARVHIDLRRDFARAFASTQPGGYLGVAGKDPRVEFIERFSDRLAALGAAVHEFGELLNAQPEAEEQIFQDFLERNTILLDVYGDVEPQPRFAYPQGESPLGKTYVEPDFLVRYPDRQYRLIEIERPGKQLGTKKGHAAADLTQAAFQTAEWKTYIANHYDLLKDRYPGISTACRTTIVISRATERQLGGERDVRQLIELYRAQLGADDVLLYDDLLARARGAYDRLSAHAVATLAGTTG